MNVVVVDDDPVVRLVLARAVSSLGHVALPAETAEVALRHLDRTSVDVVISDWLMPGLNGLELCQLVRGRDSVEYVYFVLVTAHDDREHAMAGIVAGVDDCLVKPVDLFDLRLRLMVAERVTDLHRRLAERQRGLERTNIEVAATARLDPLTGLGNRLKMNEDLEIFRSRRDRYHQPFGVALFDIDHFKSLNDAAGHLAGDRALHEVASVVRRELREADMAYRYGGEELLVALPAGARRVAAAAERIRKAVQTAGIAHPGRPGPETVVTLSAGVAAAEGDVETFLHAADAALYQAKSGGRNRVVVAGRRAAARELATSP
jgi:diguanylate cyclase (GGDEF)-like protein